MRVGVLALQGGFAPHLASVRALGHDAVPIRAADDLDDAHGLVLPGGESTAIRHLLARDGGALAARMRALHQDGAPILATCAGLILIAREVRDPPGPSLGWIDVAVSRNAWGRQIASEVAVADDGRTRLVLIRAPRIVAVGRDVQTLVTLGGEPVLVRHGAIVGATFHPELTGDLAVHRLAFGAASDPAGAESRTRRAFATVVEATSRGRASSEQESADVPSPHGCVLDLDPADPGHRGMRLQR